MEGPIVTFPDFQEKVNVRRAYFTKATGIFFSQKGRSTLPLLDPGDNFLTDENGFYLTDENGNYLVGEDA